MRETNRHILSQTSQPASGRESPLDRARRRASVAVRQRPTSATSQSRPARPGERRAAPAPVVLAPLSDAEQRELKAILSEPMDYIDHAEYHAADAEARIYGAAEIARPDVTWYRPLMDDFISARHRQPRSAKSQTTILLTGAQERVLFMKYNFARFSVSEIQKRAANRALTLDEAREVLRWHRTATAYREQIAETNLALVLAMAKRVRISEVDFADLISEGNMALMRSVDKFDCGRGFKFSTYACRAILKAFSRHGIKVTTHIRRFGAEYDPILEKSNHLETVRATHERDCADEVKFIVASNKAELSEIELKVIGHRFGLGSALDSLVATGVPSAPVSTDSLTLEQVGQMIGVTKERVRQIQNKALEKIRAALESANPAAAGDMAADIAAREGRTIPSAN